MNKSKALEFADYIKCTLEDIAVELERQHGEIESMRAERLQTERRLTNVEAQRDALLEALKKLDNFFETYRPEGHPVSDPHELVRAAIQSVEENPHT